MIVDDRIVTYIHSLEKANSGILQELEEVAHRDGVPIIRKEMESFLRVMLAIKQPQKVLEIGTAIGYSAILMSECLGVGATITTIENYEKRIQQAKENIHKAGKEDMIALMEGDAQDILQTLPDAQYDFVFMDAAKAQYIYYLPEVLRVMKPGAVLVTDNVLQEGDLIESKYVVRRRDRTIHKRMRAYMETVKNHPQLETSIIPLGDGITLSVKNKS